MEFHNPGALGDDLALTNPEYLSAVTIGVGRQDQGDVTIKWTAYNDGSSTSQSGQFVFSGTGDIVIDPTIDFNRIKIENWNDPDNEDDGGRFSASTVGLTKTILPSDQFLDFTVTATDGDGDITSTSDLSVHVVAQTSASSFTLAGTDVDDAIAGSTLVDTISGGDGFDIADYSDSTDGVSIHLDSSGGASGAPTDPLDPTVGTIGGGDATGDTLSSIEGLIGSDAEDVLVGNDSNNYLSGGADADILSGGGGADVFAWNLGDEGTTADPAEDTVTDFSLGEFGTDAEADKLDLADLLTDGVSSETIGDYIFAQQDSDDTKLYIKHDGSIASDGSNADQVIVLNDVNMGGASSEDFLKSLIDDGQLDIE